MNFQKRYNDIFLDLHTTDFVDSERKLNLFIENNPGIISDSDFGRKIYLLKAQSLEHTGKLEGALEVYLELWNKFYSVESINYLLVGLTIIELYQKLSKKEAAVKFAETVFDQISMNGFENHDLILTISVFRMLPDLDVTASKALPLHNYLIEQLDVTSEDVMDKSKLAELEKKLRNEGQWLTKILATANPSTPETTLRELEKFLASAIVPGFRSQARYTYENLKEG